MDEQQEEDEEEKGTKNVPSTNLLNDNSRHPLSILNSHRNKQSDEEDLESPSRFSNKPKINYYT